MVDDFKPIRHKIEDMITKDGWTIKEVSSKVIEERLIKFTILVKKKR